MSSVSSNRLRYMPKFTEICISNINANTEPNHLLHYFEQFGTIMQYNFTSSTGGYVFISYKDPSMVDKCMKCRPHYFDGCRLYVKRAMPVDDEHPRERFETSRDLMIAIDPEYVGVSNEKMFLSDLRTYFSSYGTVYACKYCREENFRYILIEFADNDHVDRIILEKPHYYNGYLLDVMKYLASNIEITNKKYASNKLKSPMMIKDAIDDDNYDSSRSWTNANRSDAAIKEPISEIDLEKEVYRLQNTLKTMNEDFAISRQQLEEKCSEELQKLYTDTEQTSRLHKDLEQEYTKLSAEYESLKHENELLAEEYLTAELENFEITSYYEQILSEEKAKTIQLEAEYQQKLKLLNSSKQSSSPCLMYALSSKTQLEPFLSEKN